MFSHDSAIKNKAAFTLLELMMVVIIIGILASLSLPKFVETIERARSTEALIQLGALRCSMERYFLENDGSYLGATLELLDIDDPNDPFLYPERFFDYDEPNVTSNTAYTLIARRKEFSNMIITMNQYGVIAREGY